MAIYNTILDTTPTAIVPLHDSDIAATTVYFCNKTPGPVTFNVYVTSVANPTPDEVHYSNLIYYGVQITGTDTFVLDTEKIILAPGEYIYASSSVVDSISATVSFVSI